ncbi:MAG: ABC-type transport auxiliary lipoprotein family protein [Kiritimatiellia bacterium]|jgi:ABC-type uncharacterized transport system auxiliary subunit|nr:ABC-type transport auxiliary lipoprotein family protein [Kiritimatiellia bacterium]
MNWTTLLCMPFLVLAGSGCLGGARAHRLADRQKRSFLPEASAAQPLAPAPRFGAATLRSLRIQPPFDARTFLIRRGQNEFAADFYNGWIAPPADLIRGQTARYLRETGLFETVFDLPGGTRAPLGLECIVNDLYLDHSGPEPAAVVAMRVLVLDERTPNGSVLFTCEKRARVPLTSSDAGTAAEALGRALTQTLEALTRTLAAAPLGGVR